MRDEFEKMIRDPRGWITDKGACLWTEMFRHVDSLVPGLKQEGLSSHDAGWHLYEAMVDGAGAEFRNKFVGMLYDKGWVRVGNAPGILSFEGTRAGLDRNKKTIGDITEAVSGRFGELEVREIS